jgi:hypothetical protein
MQASVQSWVDRLYHKVSEISFFFYVLCFLFCYLIFGDLNKSVFFCEKRKMYF